MVNCHTDFFPFFSVLTRRTMYLTLPHLLVFAYMLRPERVVFAEDYPHTEK